MNLADIMQKNGFNSEQCEKFNKYYKMLVEWNEKINLTTITEQTDVAYKHFLDSVLAFQIKELLEITQNTTAYDMFNGKSIIDIGTGAGFPGIPLKICFPNCKITLLDSLNKRINFLNEVTEKLGLENITALHSRAEELGKNKNHREKYDFCVSRAVANLATLSELCLPFVKVGGYFISLKGPKGEDEINMSKNAIKKLGGEFIGIYNYHIPDTELNHNIIVVKKISATSPQFPRKAPKPSKEPLL